MIARRREPHKLGSTWLLVLTLLAELSWIVELGWDGWVLGGGWWFGTVEAALLMSILVTVWALWMAPRSPRRLDFENRQLLLIGVGSAVTLLSAPNGLLVPAVVSSLILFFAHDHYHRLICSSSQLPDQP